MRRERGFVNSWYTRASSEDLPGQESIGLSPELAGPLRTKTNGDGSFVLDGIPLGSRFLATIAAAGLSKAAPPEVTGEAGQTHDFGTFVLTDLEGRLAGRVANSDGRPIAGATMFNRGDGPRPVETLTDDHGRFRLDSLFPGTKHAFVRKDVKLQHTGIFWMIETLTLPPHRRAEKVFQMDATGRPVLSY